MFIIDDFIRLLVFEILFLPTAGVSSLVEGRLNAAQKKGLDKIYGNINKTVKKSKYRNYRVGIYSQRKGEGGYLFTNIEREVTFVAHRKENQSVVTLSNPKNKPVGRVVLNMTKEGPFLNKQNKLRTLSLYIGNGLVGEVTLIENNGLSTFNIDSNALKLSIEANIIPIEKNGIVSISRFNKHVKDAYLLEFNDTTLEVFFSLVFIAINEANKYLK